MYINFLFQGDNDDEILLKFLNDQVKEISKKLQKEEEKYLCKVYSKFFLVSRGRKMGKYILILDLLRKGN